MKQYVIVFIVLLGIVGFVVFQTLRFQNTDYYKCTHRSWISTYLMKKGELGEFLTYEKLKWIKGYKRFLFNTYIPKEDGTSSEIDVILIHETGIHVFESKNYSGWIFGKDTDKTWTQVLPSGNKKTVKKHFYNPIMQNKGHIQALTNYLNRNDSPVFSYVVFSERCTLKDVTYDRKNAYCVYRFEIAKAFQYNQKDASNVLTQKEIDEIYELLYPLTQVSEEYKQKHIQDKENWMN